MKKKPKVTPKRGRGRPPIDNPAALRLNIRVTLEQRERYSRAADRAGMTLSAFALKLLDRAAG